MDYNFQLYDLMSDIILFLDAEDNITFINISAKTFFSLTDSLIGQNYFSACQLDALLPRLNLDSPTATTHCRTHQFIDWKIINSPDGKTLIGKHQLRVETPNIYFASLLNSLNQGLHIYWLDLNGRVILCNISQIHDAGLLDPQQLIGKTLHEIAIILKVPSTMADKCHANNQQVIESNKPCVFEEEFRFSENSQYFLSYKAPFYDENGKTLGILGVSTDITQMKKLQAAVEKSRHATDFYLESILMSSPSNIYWLDREGRAIGCNDRQLQRIGLKNRNDILGKTVFDVGAILGWDRRIAKKIHAHNQKVMQTRTADITRETVLLNGEERVFLSSKAPMLHAGEVVGILGISTDITEQAKIEKDLELAKQKAELSNRAKSQFIANISHDIRTPLIGIQGLATWLEERIPPEFRADVQALLSASNELLSLLNNVIHLTKLEFYEDLQSKLQTFNLNTLINQLVDLFLPVSKQKNILLKCEYPESIPRFFISDSSLIQRTILNLISNALKFTEQGHVIISVAADESMSIDENVFPLIITIEDTGIGIAPKDQTEIFSSFFRVNPSYQGKYQGSGLGLSIAKRFIETLGGKIGLHSEIGKGSRFFISLQLKVADEIPAAPVEFVDEYARNQALTSLPNRNALPSYQQTFANNIALTRVLLVEDNSLIQKSGTNTLNKLNCYVDIARNGVEAVKMAKMYHFDLILLDIGLPDYDGFWVSTQIRQLPAHSNTPIIALTGHIDQEYRDQCLNVGMNDMISKPLTLTNCKAALIRFVSHLAEST